MHNTVLCDRHMRIRLTQKEPFCASLMNMRPVPQEGTNSQYSKSGQKSMAGKAIGPQRELTCSAKQTQCQTTFRMFVLIHMDSCAELWANKLLFALAISAETHSWLLCESKCSALDKTSQHCRREGWKERKSRQMKSAVNRSSGHDMDLHAQQLELFAQVWQKSLSILWWVGFLSPLSSQRSCGSQGLPAKECYFLQQCSRWQVAHAPIKQPFLTQTVLINCPLLLSLSSLLHIRRKGH